MSPPVDRVSWEDAQGLDYRPAILGGRFGPPWTTFWFRIAATVPPEWIGARVDLLWVTGSESTLWVDGRSVQGRNTGGGGERPDATLVEEAKGGEELTFQLELACNGMFGVGARTPELERCELARFDADAWRLHFDFETLRALEATGGEGLDPSFRGEVRRELNRFCNEWDAADRASWEPARAILSALYEYRNGTHAHELAALGHAHIEGGAFFVPVVSTLGAGDVFHGALLARFVAGAPLAEALRAANVCAALSCRALDGRSAIPTLEELERSLR